MPDIHQLSVWKLYSVGPRCSKSAVGSRSPEPEEPHFLVGHKESKVPEDRNVAYTPKFRQL